MKVMDPRRYAELCAKRFLGDRNSSFGGTMPLEAELDDEVIDELKIRKALEKFGRALTEQYDRTGSGARVVGVQLHSISFSLITVPDKPARAD